MLVQQSCRFIFLLILSLAFAGPGWAHSGLKEYSAVAPDGVVLAIQEAGNPDGPPVLFIHGLLGSHLNW
ncbi:alpha/beta fold hydrolase, partial [Escherichia coli]